MIYKYYTYNIIEAGNVVGSRMHTTYIFVNPHRVYKEALRLLPETKSISDFKRIK